MLRACVAAYILYLAFGLVQEYRTSQNQTVTLIAIIVFVIGGGWILFGALRKLIKGDYEDEAAGGTNAESEEGTDIEQSGAEPEDSTAEQK